MKKLITIILTLSMIAAIFVLPSSSAATITETDAATWKYTLLMQSLKGFCYSSDEYIPNEVYTMRGMAVSHDAKYLFGGFLHPNGLGGIGMFDAATGKVLSAIQYDQGDGKFSFPKGLATDDRGYLYAALANQPNNYKNKLGIYSYAEEKLALVKDLEFFTIETDDKTGVNGITVENLNGTYYAYIVVNYKTDYLYRINVTDPSNPYIDTSFGTDGRIDLLDAVYGSGDKDNIDACYLDVDTDGTIYLALTDKPTRKLVVLSADGKTVQKSVDTGSNAAYGVALYGDYVFVCMQNTGKVAIYNKTTLDPVANVEVSADNILVPHESDDTMSNVGVSSFIYATVVNDILFLGDQGGDSACDQIFAVGLTPEAAAVVEGYSKGIHDRLASIYPDETTGGDTTADETSGSSDQTTADDTEGDNTTDAPGGDETTNAPGGDETTKPADETGCGSVIAGGAVILALMATAIVLKKRN